MSCPYREDFHRADASCRIRPLLTQDIRVRRISGRHQISTDGRHLVDGVPFGKPLLRRPAGRPPIGIPPRKRARITHEEREEDAESDYDENALVLGEQGAIRANGEPAENNNRQLVLHTDNDNKDDSEDSEDDEDFVPGGSENEEEEVSEVEYVK